MELGQSMTKNKPAPFAMTSIDDIRVGTNRLTFNDFLIFFFVFSPPARHFDMN